MAAFVSEGVSVSAQEARAFAVGRKALVYSSEVPSLISFWFRCYLTPKLRGKRLDRAMEGDTLMRCSKTGSKSSSCPSWKGYTPLEH